MASCLLVFIRSSTYLGEVVLTLQFRTGCTSAVSNKQFSIYYGPHGRAVCCILGVGFGVRRIVVYTIAAGMLIPGASTSYLVYTSRYILIV